ncbi:MAG: hypothetical protein ACRC4Q_04625 [Paraclostridium dentum]
MREKMGFIQRERRGRVMKRQPRAGQGWVWKTFQRRWRWTTVKLKVLHPSPSSAIASR